MTYLKTIKETFAAHCQWCSGRRTPVKRQLLVCRVCDTAPTAGDRAAVVVPWDEFPPALLRAIASHGGGVPLSAATVASVAQPGGVDYRVTIVSDGVPPPTARDLLTAGALDADAWGRGLLQAVEA